MSSSISSEEQRKAMIADTAVIDDDAASAVQQKEVIKKKTKKKTFRLPDDELELILAFKPSVHYPDPIFSPVLEEKLPDTVRGVRATMAKADALKPRSPTTRKKSFKFLDVDGEDTGPASPVAAILWTHPIQSLPTSWL
uniref:Uncharacterized protein n=1 Tax=Aegilops tauschii subsp. strangulata TaxID=200361 RepID=A0A453G303_AEGTS